MNKKKFLSILSFTFALIFTLSITSAYANTPTQVRLTPSEYSDQTELRWYNAGQKIRVNYENYDSSNRGFSLHLGIETAGMHYDIVKNVWVPKGTNYQGFDYIVPTSGYYLVKLHCNGDGGTNGCDGWAGMDDY
ncbi:hypothetical protein [Hazenella coriacea]|uniref:Uncharacterized protein n=1 Tax=Hazenella coriacea TaxID=1179467 RepID=A0A4R3L4P0_9BACL|nr:hypothetical protein [Hazenella coriacea]TCS93948.1 hypothetical protein EDD58_105159 [Hazenella coriacea]